MELKEIVDYIFSKEEAEYADLRKFVNEINKNFDYILLNPYDVHFSFDDKRVELSIEEISINEFDKLRSLLENVGLKFEEIVGGIEYFKISVKKVDCKRGNL